MSKYVPYVTHFDIARPYNYRIRCLLCSVVISQNLTKVVVSAMFEESRFSLRKRVIVIDFFSTINVHFAYANPCLFTIPITKHFLNFVHLLLKCR